MRYRKFILLFFLFAFSVPVLAQQNAGISGQIRDNDELITGASVSIKGTQTGTLSDKDGGFQLNNLKAGDYTLQISFLGYISEIKQVSLKPGQQVVLNFKLKKDAKQLNDVAISAKTAVRKVKETGFAVTSVELKNYANTTADLNQVLNRSAGVKVREQGGLGSDFNFSINGLSGSHIKFFIDGIPLESFGSGMTLNNIPVNLAERVDIYKGVVPAFLGSDALGGAVNIITKRNSGKSIDASYSYGSFNTHRAALTGSFTDKKTGIHTNITSYYNFSDNNYTMYNNPKANALLRVVENGQFVTKDKLDRFHDGYESFMGQIESGVSNKKWADVFVAGITYTSNYKERQTGATQEKVIGQMFTRGHNIIPSIRYRKENLLVTGLSASVFANFSANKTVVTDTSGNVYNWDGTVRERRTGSELSGDKPMINHITGHYALAQVNFGYVLGENHQINLSHNFNRSYRESYNEIDPYNNTYDRSNSLNKNITGLSYQQQLFNQKLTTNFFGKRFGLDGTTYSKDNVPTSQSKQYFGYGIATNYKIVSNLGIKASYEHAYRLPELVELYGNREDVLGNPNLKPESSNNYNLGIYYDHKIGSGKISAEATGFYRDANDYIITTPSTSGSAGSYSQYYNTDGIKVSGLEGEVRYEHNNLFSLLVNMSYQNAVNRQQYSAGTVRENITYLSRVPNQPWLYGNADFSIGKNDLVGKDTRVQFNWFTQFINDYSVTWSKLGDKDTKDYIPKQFIQNATLTYSTHGGRYNISLEGRNLTNVIAYDNFKLQKPGRSFFIKLRYAFSQSN